MAVEGAAAVVTLDWPERRNALGPQDAAVLTGALERATAADVAAVVLTGRGAFCSGGDLRRYAELSATASEEEILETVFRTVQRVVGVLRTSPVPTIAAVDGAAVGLGLDYALACDMRFVGPNGWLQQGWARAGLIPGTGGIGLLHRLNPAALWRLVGTQERLDAAECARLGLGEAAVPSALDAARSRAEALRAIPRPALRHYCRLSRQVAWPSASHFRESARVQAGLLASEEFRRRADEVLAR